MNASDSERRLVRAALQWTDVESAGECVKMAIRDLKAQSSYSGDLLRRLEALDCMFEESNLQFRRLVEDIS